MHMKKQILRLCLLPFFQRSAWNIGLLTMHTQLMHTLYHACEKTSKYGHALYVCHMRCWIIIYSHCAFVETRLNVRIVRNKPRSINNHHQPRLLFFSITITCYTENIRWNESGQNRRDIRSLFVHKKIGCNNIFEKCFYFMSVQANIAR